MDREHFPRKKFFMLTQKVLNWLSHKPQINTILLCKIETCSRDCTCKCFHTKPFLKARTIYCLEMWEITVVWNCLSIRSACTLIVGKICLLTLIETIFAGNNVCSEKKLTKRSSNTVLCLISVSAKQTLSVHARIIDR